MRIKISTNSTGDVYGKISEENPKTSQAIFNALPIEAKVNKWGDEIYFSISVEVEAENSIEVVEIGDIAYWPPGNAFCIFFGPTPISSGSEIKPASSVNVIGKIIGDPTVFKKVKSGENIKLEKD